MALTVTKMSCKVVPISKRYDDDYNHDDDDQSIASSSIHSVIIFEVYHLLSFFFSLRMYCIY